LLALAQQAFQAGSWQEGLARADEGLKLVPDDSALLALRKKLERAARLDELLNTAEQQMQGMRLTTPKGNNAYESYQQVLELDPTNQKAKEGIANIAKKYQGMAEQRMSNGSLKSLQSGLDYVDKGLKILPNDGELLALREEMQELLDKRQREAKRQREPPRPTPSVTEPKPPGIQRPNPPVATTRRDPPPQRLPPSPPDPPRAEPQPPQETKKPRIFGNF
jgi:tetratricopeptide (TPR) repeat protein